MKKLKRQNLNGRRFECFKKMVLQFYFFLNRVLHKTGRTLQGEPLANP